MTPVDVQGPDSEGKYRVVLAVLNSLDGDLNAVIDFIQRSLEAARAASESWHLLSAVKTTAAAGGGMSFYIEAIPKWRPADNNGQGKPS